MFIGDYLQLIKGRGKVENRQMEVAEITRSLKALAKELKIPVLALSQLSRAVEHRGVDQRPQLSDLRESGAIEQDADLIAFIYREELYNRTEENKGKAELNIAKHRNGPIGQIKMRFKQSLTKFENLENISSSEPSLLELDS